MTTERKFDALYSNEDKKRKAERKPGVEARLKRKFQSARDDAGDKILDAEDVISKLQENVENYDVNAVLAQEETVKALKSLQDSISGQYKSMFGTEM